MNSDTPVIQSENIPTSIEVSDKNKNEKLSIFFSFVLILSGFAIIMGGSFSDYFRTAEGIFHSKFTLIIAIGTAFILNGLLIKTKWNRFGLWTGFALIGQAASLQMINAGQTIHFQHYYFLSELVKNNSLSLVLIAFQIVFVTYGISFHLKTIKNWIINNFAWWQLIIILLFTFIAGAAVTRDISIYISSLLTAFILQFINLANVILIGFTVPKESFVWLQEKSELILGEENEQSRNKIDRFIFISALWVILLSASLSYFVYQRHPHVPDETVYLFQAKYMAAGQLVSKAPLVPEAFSVYMIPTYDSSWFSIFPPAWSALLAIGIKANLEWLVNPLLAGFCVILTYIFFQEFYSRRFARIGILLLCCSPWFIFMAMSFMSHIFTLVCALVAAILLSRSLKNSKLSYAFGAGLAIGGLSLIRPLDGVIVALLFGVWTLIVSPTWKNKILTSIFLFIGTITTASLVFPYNKSVTGNAFLLPMDAYYTKYYWKNANGLGFGSDRGMGWALDAFPGHSPLEAVLNSVLNTFSMNIELFGWGFGSLILVVCLIISGFLQKKDIWAIVSIIAVVGGFGFFWYHGGPDFGARYWFLCIIPLVALTVRGIEWLSEKTANENTKNSNPVVLVVLAILCLSSLLTYFPWRSLDKYYHYLGMQPGILELNERHNFGKSLVLISGNEHPDYQSAWVYNPVNFEGDSSIYAWDKNPEIRKKLLQAYSDRIVWFVDAPSITNSGYKVRQGPIEAKELLSKETE